MKEACGQLNKTFTSQSNQEVQLYTLVKVLLNCPQGEETADSLRLDKGTDHKPAQELQENMKPALFTPRSKKSAFGREEKLEEQCFLFADEL